jgi:hypothetical protein
MFRGMRVPARVFSHGTCALLMLLAVLAGPPAAAASDDYVGDAGTGQEWLFRVYLNDREIGYHSFRIEQVGDFERIEIEASFDVRVLFFNAYQYRHSNVEYWRDGCLQRIDSVTVTDDNGDPHRVTGESRSGAFVYATVDERNLETFACTRSFAYWNPDLLQAGPLLNAQTGEIVETRLERVTDEQFRIGGATVPAERYELSTNDGVIVLWYAKDSGKWLALEAPAPGGRTLRYEPLELPGMPPARDRLALN